MKLKTFLSLVGGRRGLMGARLMRLSVSFFRVYYLSAAFSSGLLAMLSDGPMSVEQVAQRIAPNPATADAVRAWLDMGVGAGVLRFSGGKYAIKRGLAKFISDPRNDAFAAFFEELTEMDGPSLTLLPQRLRQGRLLTLADQKGEIVARSSLTIEPLIQEAIDAIVPESGPFRLLDVGCGSGAYIRYAAERNRELSAFGLELQPQVAAFARDNVRGWGLDARSHVEAGDIRERAASVEFDAVMLNNNIYYFPVEKRVDLLRHLGGFLKPGGRLLITSQCLARNVFSGLLDIWSAGCEGCGRLPIRDELVRQMGEAGFARPQAKALVPLGQYYARDPKRRRSCRSASTMLSPRCVDCAAAGSAWNVHEVLCLQAERRRTG
jgi:SAM-dependent methyltransferase